MLEALIVVGLLIGGIMLAAALFVLLLFFRGYRAFMRGFRKAQEDQKAKQSAEAKAKEYMARNYPLVYRRLYPQD